MIWRKIDSRVLYSDDLAGFFYINRDFKVQSLFHKIAFNYSTALAVYLTDKMATTLQMIVANSTADVLPADGEEYTSELAEIDKYFWIFFSPIFLIFGVVGNILNILVLIRMKFYKNATLLLLFCLAWTDMVVLIVGLPRYWLTNTFDFDLRTVSQFSCKFSLFLIYFSMQLSSWILVLVTLIRFVKTVFSLKYSSSKGFVNMRKTIIAFCIIAIILICINFHLFITNGINSDGDCSSLTEEYLEFDEKVFVFIDFAFLSLIPAIIMIVCNVFIFLKIRELASPVRRMSIGQMNPNKVQKKTISKVTMMIVITSVYFIIATVPISIYFIVDSYVRPGASAKVEAQLDLAWTITYLFEYSQFTLNFYLYTSTNDSFRKHLKNMFHVNKWFGRSESYDPANTSEMNHKPSATLST